MAPITHGTAKKAIFQLHKAIYKIIIVNAIHPTRNDFNTSLINSIGTNIVINWLSCT